MVLFRFLALEFTKVGKTVQYLRLNWGVGAVAQRKVVCLERG